MLAPFSEEPEISEHHSTTTVKEKKTVAFEDLWTRNGYGDGTTPRQQCEERNAQDVNKWFNNGGNWRFH